MLVESSSLPRNAEFMLGSKGMFVQSTDVTGVNDLWL